MQKLAFLFALIFLVSCEDDKGYFISGTIEVPNGKEIYISELNNQTNRAAIVDTLTVTDGTFKIDPPEVDSPHLSFLTVEGIRGNVLFIASNDPIEFKIHKDSLFATEVSGGKDNTILYTYLENLRATNKKMGSLQQDMRKAFSSQDSVQLAELRQTQETLMMQGDKAKKELVQENPNSIVSLLVMQEMVNSRRFTFKEINELFKGIDEDVKNSALGQRIGESLEKLSKLAIGSKAPTFKGPNPEGEEIALEDVMGEVTLIDFWASWCKPCREENPNIVNVYEKYHDQGFNVIGISLDRPGQKDKWLAAIEEDKLSWPQISNLQFWNGPIARNYEIRAIPASFIVDENGVIVAKNVRGAALEKKIAELLSEE